MNLLADPVAIGNRVLRNRLVMTPHIGRLPTPRLAAYIEERARAGVAMIVIPAGDAVYNLPLYHPEMVAAFESTAPDPDGMARGVGRSGFGKETLPALRTRLTALAGAAQQHGALAIGQIHHPGAERSWDSFQPVVAPSAVPADASAATPHELTTSEIDSLVIAYVESAACIVDAGMDGVELHAGHGYLLNRFLSPYYNRRDDAYGGTAAGRLRLLLRILIETRGRIGDEPLLGVRLPASEELPDGLSPADIAGLVREVSAKASYLSVSLGNHDGLRDGHPTTAYTAPWLVGDAPAGDAARTIRAESSCPVIVTGRVTTPAAAARLVESGAADLVGLARALIADPTFVQRALRDEAEQIVSCIGCNECTLTPFSCPVNPAAGREAELRLRPASRRRRIVVVGAGPAGANAAIRASARGHEVILLDEAVAVGGMLLRAPHAEPAAHWQRFAGTLQRGVRDAGVDFRPGVHATDGVIGELAPDCLVVATGSEPVASRLASDARVVRGDEVLAGRVDLAGESAIVVGGREPHLEPLLVADALLTAGKNVTLLSEHAHVGPALEPRTLNFYLAKLLRAGMALRPMTRALAWQDGVLLVRNLYAEQDERLETTVVVSVAERRAADSLARDVQARFGDELTVHLIGDALAPRRFTHAALEGARLGVAV
jgi:2,4-dienoyl-CoA reductase (NADPH2)